MEARLGGRIQLIGDDLYVTNSARILQGADNGCSNAAFIKNQVGTVSQTFDAIAAARSRGMACMISHRSGETDDTFIADLAVGSGVDQIKSGALAQGERAIKYHGLTDIEVLHPRDAVPNLPEGRLNERPKATSPVSRRQRHRSLSWRRGTASPPAMAILRTRCTRGCDRNSN